MDLNADLGEGFGIWRLGDDEALLDLVTSANVACGFHAGDPSTMRRVCEGAAERGVAVGAQVGYRDLAGFGRRRIAYDFAELRDEVTYQLGALDAFCRLFGTRVRYLKPHGALYHAAGTDESQAAAVVAAVTGYDPSCRCLPARLDARPARRRRGPAGRRRGLRRPRLPAQRGVGAARHPAGAVITDPEQVVERAVRMAVERSVVAVDGTVIPCSVELDLPARRHARARSGGRLVRASLIDADIPLAPFA